MQRFNCIIVIHPDGDKLLFCKRVSEPYAGLYNFVGGKIEQGEDGLAAAYRELFEETGIDAKTIDLVPFMDYVWHLQNISMQVYCGALKREMPLRAEKHPLWWLCLDENYFDMLRFAGEGNIGHMVEILKLSQLVTDKKSRMP